MLEKEFVCPKCGSALGSFVVNRGIPCAKCNIFFETAWGSSEDGKRRQYLTPVKEYGRRKKE